MSTPSTWKDTEASTVQQNNLRTPSHQQPKRWQEKEGEVEVGEEKNEDDEQRLTRSCARNHSPNPHFQILQERETTIKRRLQQHLDVRNAMVQCQGQTPIPPYAPTITFDKRVRVGLGMRLRLCVCMYVCMCVYVCVCVCMCILIRVRCAPVQHIFCVRMSSGCNTSSHGQGDDFSEVIRLGAQLQNLSQSMEGLGKVQVCVFAFLCACVRVCVCVCVCVCYVCFDPGAMCASPTHVLCADACVNRRVQSAICSTTKNLFACRF